MRRAAWRHALVLGGTRSGKSEYAESLIADAASVRYIATAWHSADDAEWARRIEAHRQRRPVGWSTVEIGPRPAELLDLLRQADPEDVLLIDELGTWVGALLAAHSDDTAGGDGRADNAAGDNAAGGDGRADIAAAAASLGAAIAACPPPAVGVSPEVGLAPVALTPAGRAFVDALGAVNIAAAAACDVVVLVVAGQPVRVKGVIEPPHTERGTYGRVEGRPSGRPTGNVWSCSPPPNPPPRPRSPRPNPTPRRRPRLARRASMAISRSSCRVSRFRCPTTPPSWPLGSV